MNWSGRADLNRGPPDGRREAGMKDQECAVASGGGEARAESSPALHRYREKLQRDMAAQFEVFGFIDHTHAPRHRVAPGCDRARWFGRSCGGHFAPCGKLRRSSSKKLKMKLTLFTAAVCSVTGAFNTAKRLPSGCRPKLGLPSPRSVNWPGDQSWGLSAWKV